MLLDLDERPDSWSGVLGFAIQNFLSNAALQLRIFEARTNPGIKAFQ